MELTPVQQRTLDVLVRPPPNRLEPGFARQLRERLESRLAALDLPGDVWLSKSRLNDRARCEGAFAADLAGEREAFSHRWETAVGAIAHRAAQADVAAERAAEPRAVVQYALAKLLEDLALGVY